jgi:hypothetical protein
MRLLPRLSRLGKQKPFYVLRTALERLPLRPAEVNRLHLLQFDGIPDVPAGSLRGPARIRSGCPEDLEDLLRVQDQRGVFLDRFASGDHCALAVVSGEVAGYEWFTTRPRHPLPPFNYAIDVPRGSIYAYDAYILPRYRLCGIWLGFKNHLAGLMRELSLNRVVTYVEYGNDLSLRTHLRFGFTHFRTATVLRVLGARMSFETVPRA